MNGFRHWSSKVPSSDERYRTRQYVPPDGSTQYNQWNRLFFAKKEKRKKKTTESDEASKSNCS